MNSPDVESIVKGVLEAWGFDVEKIPEVDSAETPDFMVRDADASYLIEVKARGDDPAQLAERDKALDLGKIFEEHLPLVRQNRVSGILGKASSQLDAFCGEESYFRIIWLVTIGRVQEAKMWQIEATLYGTTSMFDLDSGDNAYHCYFFRNSDFYRYRHILDAAIVSNLNSGKLYLNCLSPRYESLKSTALFERFGGGVCDPFAEESAGIAYVVDSDVDRKDKEAVLSYLRVKYGRQKLMNIDLGYTAVSTLVPSKGLT